MSLLRRSGQQALQALLELAEAPQQWRSVNEIAAAQDLPAPMLEQLLLQLRRAGLVEARRGRLGGYRLQREPASIAVSEVLAAVGADIALVSGAAEEPSLAEQQVLRSMASRLQRAIDRELMQFNLQELLFDLRSCRESLSGDGGLMLG
ncbi:MAG: Rrf2 family transcriptional regulator [Cyanobacteria bacterium K_DeepCast_150m_m2_101]|nr:Rrf2 family transcriptional regulator [Cyanobacteria bacterium K_DeepCast_150m_m2_101]